MSPIFVKDLYDATIRQISSNSLEWQKYLDCASKIWKHKYDTQILIYGQKPNAAFVAKKEVWEKLGRQIYNVEDAIMVYDTSKPQINIQYLFDVSQTRGPEKTSPKAWRINREYGKVLTDRINKNLNQSYKSFEDVIAGLTKSYVNIVADSYLEQESDQISLFDDSRDKNNRNFKMMLENSVTYYIAKRCDYPLNQVPAFFNINHINDRNTILKLCNAVNSTSGIILRMIEPEIIKLIKENQKERGNKDGDTLRGKGRDIISTDRNGGESRSGREIRSDVAGVHSRERPGQVHGDVSGGDSVQYSEESKRRGIGSAEQDSRGEIEDRSTGGSIQHLGGIPSSDDAGERSRGIRPGGDSIQKIEDVNTEDKTLIESVNEDLQEPEQNQGSFSYAKNFRMTDFSFVNASPIQKIRNNIEAINCLKIIESQNRPATQEEKEILTKYTGWGGVPQVFDDKSSKWRTEYEVLKSCLTQDEYARARASTVNAHYTMPAVIEVMYAAINKNGFSGGKILEPSMGAGYFFSMLPEKMQNSELYGIELDNISGRISQKLFPNANIEIKGFEKTKFDNDYFDLAIGNVPFGTFSVFDEEYKDHNFLLHDYFIAKMVDKVRPGGIIAVITGKDTLDRKDSSTREYIASKADLVGAIRLPNNAFKSIANTDVTTDILFLQKKKEPLIDARTEWLNVGTLDNGVPVNVYYINHPEMLLGNMVFHDRFKKMYGDSQTTTLESNNQDLIIQLKSAINNIKFNPLGERDKKGEKEPAWYNSNTPAKDGALIPKVITEIKDVKNYTYAIINNNIYFRENNQMQLVTASDDVKQRIKGLNDIRVKLRDVINIQLSDCSNEELAASQEELNKVYDKFVEKYGYISSPKNKKAFKEDSDYALLLSIEIEKNEQIIKTDIFNKRTIKPVRKIEHVETAIEALAVSLNERGKVDIEYMAKLCGHIPEQVIEALGNAIFLNPEKWDRNDITKGWESNDEYLSGNVKDKLRVAEIYSKKNPMFMTNVEALKRVQPVEIDASQIDVKLGTPWIDAEDIEKFMYETLNTSYLHQMGRDKISALNYKSTASWSITNKHTERSVEATKVYGTSRLNAYQIIENSLNNRQCVVRDKQNEYDPTTQTHKVKYVVNQKETVLAREKQRLIEEEFHKWIFSDLKRRRKYVEYYNNTFNSIRLRHFDGSHLTLPGINPAVKLRDIQLNEIARIILSGGSSLLAQPVGSGKTYEMIAGCMELKRLGLANKSIITVPNHLTGQFGADFMRLYPTANILITSKEDFKKENRKRFINRIATGDYDAVIIGHSQFEKIPISDERKRKEIEREIDELQNTIEVMKKEDVPDWSVKQSERQKFILSNKLQALLSKPKDDTLTFEELGVDALFVDEAHYFKNCAVFSKMTNVAGVSNSNSQKASDMLTKARYIQEINNGRNVIFATATPISNSISEMYVMMRYLDENALKNRDIHCFDAWASQFGRIVGSLELAPEGTGYRFRNRFAQFVNLPELMSMFKRIACVQTAEMLNLPVPKCTYETVVAKPNNYIKDKMIEFSSRADAVRNGCDPKKDNMLKITNEARQLGVDARLQDAEASAYDGSKLNLCVKNIIKEYEASKDILGTQIVFCDLGTPTSQKEFNVYQAIKDELFMHGIPEYEICFIHDAKTDVQREAMFAELKSGKKRIIIGSTAKMGTGTNIQDRVVAMHHIDAPWRPADIEQREGRAIRQGNINDNVNIYRYVTEDTFDAYMWSVLETKQKFINQVMTSNDNTVRSCQDIDETVLNYAEVKALATGDVRIKEKIEVDNEVSRLSLLKMQYDKNKYNMQEDIETVFPMKIKKQENYLERLKSDLEIYRKNNDKKFNITISGEYFDNRKDAGQVLISLVKNKKSLNRLDDDTSSQLNKLGEYKGFNICFYPSANRIILKGMAEHSFEFFSFSELNETGITIKFDNLLNNIEAKIDKALTELNKINDNFKATRIEYAKPFIHEDELAELIKRKDELNKSLSLSEIDSFSVIANELEEINEADAGKKMLKDMKDIVQEYRHKKEESNVTDKMIPVINEHLSK